MIIKAWLVWKSSNLVTNDFQREHPWLGDFPAMETRPETSSVALTHPKNMLVIWGWVKTLVPSEPQVIAGLIWMFIPLKMVLIGIDPSPFESIIPFCNSLLLFLLVQVSFIEMYRYPFIEIKTWYISSLKIGLNFDPSKRPASAPRRSESVPLYRGDQLCGWGWSRWSLVNLGWIVTIFQSGTWGCNGYNNV